MMRLKNTLFIVVPVIILFLAANAQHASIQQETVNYRARKEISELAIVISTEETCGETLVSYRIQVQTFCGNGSCDPGENSETCPQDCASGILVPVCGDGKCDEGEAGNCFQDCGLSCIEQDCDQGEYFDWDQCKCVSEITECVIQTCLPLEMFDKELCRCVPKVVCGDGVCDSTQENSTNCSEDCPASAPPPSSKCGDGRCDKSTENSSSCPQDCPLIQAGCGNGTCDSAKGENAINCPLDCGEEIEPYDCGNGVCEASLLEDYLNCPKDCNYACGDGACFPGETRDNCPSDCLQECGNGFCEQEIGETRDSCSTDCLARCGNNQCEAGIGEDSTNCPSDCHCGNGVCEDKKWEDSNSCPEDCVFCGDNICDPVRGEDWKTCQADCFCGNGVCDTKKGENTTNCIQDCNVCGDNRCFLDTENYKKCPSDCAPGCGDGTCDRLTENIMSCPADCPNTGVVCGDGKCDLGEGPLCCADCCGDGICEYEEKCLGECDLGIFAKILGPMFRPAGSCTPELPGGTPKQPQFPMCPSTAVVVTFVCIMGLSRWKRE